MRRVVGSLLGLLAALALMVSGCSLVLTEGPGGSGSGQDPAATAPAATAPAESGDAESGGVDPESGLPWIEVEELPQEAHETLELIDHGGPFPYDKDGSTFGNFEGYLPEEPRGHYREYTVESPGLDHRGPLRIVTGGEDTGQGVAYYWTSDHYESFERIRR
ncbi:ribonuclease domain-containing protein [Propioniferax innocua]|uniref:Ribonuclease T1 n=1 Tax=Propioniferax innocua TaxID=1753 RepID=A0A542ZR30_9ACTN|nr:ribonuclease domain-containing protein [Propioniferax innocua]TQL62815.1 ribonuclease T1 [Propioniferax innocua]